SATRASRPQEGTASAPVARAYVKHRTVSFTAPQGNVETITVGPEVKNLAQMKRGDHVVATYYQSVAFEVVKKSDAKLGATAVEGTGRAKEGTKPGAIDAREVTIVADIVSLDRKNQQAVLKGPKGETVTVDVQNPDNFDKVKVGDRVQITLTEAVAIDVHSATKTH